MNGSPSHRSFVASHLRDIPRSGIRDFFDIVSGRAGVISLGIGEPDFLTPWHIREASIFALDRGATSYTANLGTPELRAAIADYVRRATGVAFDPACEVLVTVGVSEALDLAVRSAVNPGDEVLYHEPCYVSYAPVARFAHGSPRPVATRAQEGFRLMRAALEAAVTPRSRVLLLNFPTNPTGAILTEADAADIAAFARERDLLVITDEVYEGLSYEQRGASVLSQPGMRGRTVYLNGMSKTWAMTGFRIGFACAPPELIEAMMKVHQYTMLCAPTLSQKAAVEALRSGASDSEVMRREYRLRRNLIHGALNAMGLPCLLPQGAFYAFPDIRPTGLDSKTFALRLLEEQNVACVPGSAFGAAGEGYLRCSFATGMDPLREALRRMEMFVRSLA
jgi:aminotransferase